MSTSAAMITSLINSFTSLKTFFEGERANLELARSNVKAAVNAQMSFQGTVDPDNADQNPEDGGVFPTIHSLVFAAPVGALIQITLLSDKMYIFDENLYVGNRVIRFVKSGDGADPQIKAMPYLLNGVNYQRYMFMDGGEVTFRNVNLILSAPLADPNALVSIPRSSFITYQDGASVRVGFSGGVIFGADGRGLVTLRNGTAAMVSLNDVTLDGAFAVTNSANGCAMVATTAITLSNGGALTDGGTVGTNLLIN